MNRNLKKWLCLSLGLVLIVFAFTGCMAQEPTAEKPPLEDNGGKPPEKPTEKPPEKPAKPASSTLGDVLTGMKGASFKIEEETDIAANDYGALYGKRFNLNGKPVEVYEFDPTALTGDMKKLYDAAKTSGKVTVNGEERTVLVNGNYMIAGYDKHPDLKKIEEFFKGYKTN